MRECFATNPDDVLVLRMSANKKKAIHAKLSLSMLRESELSTDGNQLIFDGTVNFPKQGPGGVSFQGRSLYLHLTEHYRLKILLYL